MYTIALSSHDPAWTVVADAIARRMRDLADEATSLATTDRDRLIASARLDELRLLLAAPDDTLSVSINRHEGINRLLSAATY